ncbi:MAG: GNAT family N-acetyltransferase [Anaerolineaceae bacterium]|nr:GNAT family N-acetyltransferase [Anaerolineaceae bacterium]
MNTTDFSSSLRLERVDPRSPLAARLIADLSAELGARYNYDGAGHFKPEDALGPGACFIAASLDDRPAGCGALRPFVLPEPGYTYFGQEGQAGPVPGVGEVKRMYVAPELRGLRIAQRILEALEAAGREFGYHTLVLETGILQPEAIRLYQRFGFTPIPLFPPYAQRDNSLCFEKSLIA